MLKNWIMGKGQITPEDNRKIWPAHCHSSCPVRFPQSDALNCYICGSKGYEGFPGSSAGKESACNAGRYPRDRLPTPVFLGFPVGSAGKDSTSNVEDLVSVPRFRRSPGEGKGYPLQYSSLEDSMDCIVHGVTKSRTRLTDFHFHRLWNTSTLQAFIIKIFRKTICLGK